MIKNKITKRDSKIAYVSSIIIIFLSLCAIPTLGLIMKIEKFQCDGCSFFNNFLVSLIGILAWSIFYGVFHIAFFSNDCRSDKINISNIYQKFLQHSMRERRIQSISMFIVFGICYLLILRFFIFQILDLIKEII
jgi:hypothetical protein